jgi:cell wall assembly regulator SMI1
MLTAHAPDLLASLRPPATEAQIDAAESKLGVQSPAEIRRAYSRHDARSHGVTESWGQVSHFPKHVTVQP